MNIEIGFKIKSMLSVVCAVSMMLSFFYSISLYAKEPNAAQKNLYPYLNQAEDLLGDELFWFDGDDLDPLSVSILEHISKDRDFIKFVDNFKLLLDKKDLDSDVTLKEFDHQLSRLAILYLIVEFDIRKLDRSRSWARVVDLIQQKDLQGLHQMVVNNDPKLQQLRGFLYRYLELNINHEDNLLSLLYLFDLDLEAPTLKTLRPLMSDDQVLLAGILLENHGFPVEHKPSESNYYSRDMLNIVQRFQKSNRLKVDGIIGKNTWGKLLSEPHYALKAIRFTLGRMRQDTELGDRENRVVINIPAYQMLINNLNVMSVIVGTNKNQTPIMHNSISQVVINPKWHIPKRIVREYIKPKLMQDSEYLMKQNIKVFDMSGRSKVLLNAIYDPAQIEKSHHLVQSEGPGNALGLIKFVTNSKQAIMLHDTNARGLFNRNYRALSNGCIRLSKPWLLLDYISSVYEEDKISDAKLKSVLERGKTKPFYLGSPFHVKTVYWLAWVDESEKLNVYHDVYSYSAYN